MTNTERLNPFDEFIAALDEAEREYAENKPEQNEQLNLFEEL